jgi:hypothetical protein
MSNSFDSITSRIGSVPCTYVRSQGGSIEAQPQLIVLAGDCGSTAGHTMLVGLSFLSRPAVGSAQNRDLSSPAPRSSSPVGYLSSANAPLLPARKSAHTSDGIAPLQLPSSVQPVLEMPEVSCKPPLYPVSSSH